MNSKQYTLVYSLKGESLLKLWQDTNGEANAVYNFASSVEDLKKFLKQFQYDKIIIDNNNADSYSNILDIVNTALKSSIPINVENLQMEIPEDFEIQSKIEFTEDSDKPLVSADQSSMPTEEQRRLVSRTAATLSHEINNPLLAICANTEMLLRDHESLSDDVRDKLVMINKAAERIRDVTIKLIQLETVDFKDTAAGKMINIADKPNSVENGPDIVIGKPIE